MTFPMIPTVLTSVVSASLAWGGVAVAQEAPPVVREKSQTEHAAPLEMEVFDVRDLTGQDKLEALARDIVSDAVSTETRMILLERYRELLEAGEVRGAMQNLVAAIEELAHPAFAGPQQAVQAIGEGQITILGNAAQRDWVRGFLAELRRDPSLITVRVQVILLPKGQLMQLLPDGVPRFVGADELEQVRARTADFDTLNSPQVAVWPGQRAELSVLDQTAYIKDYSVEVVNGEQIVDPEIDVLSTGLEFDVRVAPVAPGRFALRSEFSLTSAKRPFPKHTVRVGALQTEVTVELPQVERMKVEGRFDVALGTAVLLGGFAPDGAPVLHNDGEAGEEVLLLVEVLRAAVPPTQVQRAR